MFTSSVDETTAAPPPYTVNKLMTVAALRSDKLSMFCRIERASKRRFVVALTGNIAEKRDKVTLEPLIKKYILHRSIIFSDCWGAYTGLSDLEGFNYRHFTINHSTNFVHEEDKNIHT